MLILMSLKYLKQESIPVGCIPPACRLGLCCPGEGGGTVQGGAVHGGCAVQEGEVVKSRGAVQEESAVQGSGAVQGVLFRGCCSGGAVQGVGAVQGQGVMSVGVVLSRECCCLGVVLSMGLCAWGWCCPGTGGDICWECCCLRGASITECYIITPLPPPPVNRMTGRQV